MEISNEMRVALAFVGVCFIIVYFVESIKYYVGIGLIMIGVYTYCVKLYEEFAKPELNDEVQR